MSSKEERTYIAQGLMKEIRDDLERMAKEYQQPRDLGALGEFANLYRKVRKLKTLMWPGENSYAGHEWREDQRTIVKEIVMHGLLLLNDLDRLDDTYKNWIKEQEEDDDEDEEDEEDFTPQGKKAQTITDAERQERERIQERLRQRRMQGSAFAATPLKED